MTDAPVDHVSVGQLLAERQTPTRSRWAAPLLALAVGLFVVSGWSLIGAPFGDSHDGRNAGVWVAGSRSLVGDGPIASRMGTGTR